MTSPGISQSQNGKRTVSPVEIDLVKNQKNKKINGTNRKVKMIISRRKWAMFSGEANPCASTMRQAKKKWKNGKCH